MAIPTTTGAAFDRGASVSLFQVPIRVDPLIDQYAVTRDGQRFIFGAPDDSAAPITVVLNWAAGLTASQAGTGAGK